MYTLSSLGNEFGLTPIPKNSLSENWHSSDELDTIHQTFFKVLKDVRPLGKSLISAGK